MDFFICIFLYLGGHEVFEHFFKSMDLAPWQIFSDNTNYNLPAWMAIRVDRNFDNFCTDIFAAS